MTYPSGIVVGYDYTPEGYLQQVRKGAQILDTFNAMNAFGSVTDESLGNGLRTVRAIDPNSGRVTSIQTGTPMVPESIQNLEYVWRSNGALYKRADLETEAAGTADDRWESATYDALNRLETATAVVPGVMRTLSFAYNPAGNLTGKTSTISGDLNATNYTYTLSAKPHRLITVAINGVTNTVTHDANGCITQYGPASGDKRFISYDGRNQATNVARQSG